MFDAIFTAPIFSEIDHIFSTPSGDPIPVKIIYPPSIVGGGGIGTPAGYSTVIDFELYERDIDLYNKLFDFEQYEYTTNGGSYINLTEHTEDYTGLVSSILTWFDQEYDILPFIQAMYQYRALGTVFTEPTPLMSQADAFDTVGIPWRTSIMTQPSNYYYGSRVQIQADAATILSEKDDVASRVDTLTANMTAPVVASVQDIVTNTRTPDDYITKREMANIIFRDLNYDWAYTALSLGGYSIPPHD